MNSSDDGDDDDEQQPLAASPNPAAADRVALKNAIISIAETQDDDESAKVT